MNNKIKNIYDNLIKECEKEKEERILIVLYTLRGAIAAKQDDKLANIVQRFAIDMRHDLLSQINN